MTTPATTTTKRRATTRRAKTPAAGQRGIAVLLVVACLAVLAPFTATFNYQARVDWQSAINVRDEVAARNIQRGAMRLSLLLFELQRRVFNQKQFREMVGNMDITQVAPYLMSVFGTEDGAEGVGALVGIDTSALSELAISGGTFEYRVMAESGKVNVNCLAQQSTEPQNNPAARVVQTLEAMMVPSLYNPLFEEEKSDGQFYTRQDIVMAMADYIDDDRERFDIVRLRSRSGPESYRYTELFDPYEARNARLDSIDELHLVEGIDDDWMAAFGSELTVYGGCKVNLNFASAEQIALVLAHSAKGDEKWKVEGENFLLKTVPLAKYIIEAREFSLFREVGDFQKIAEQPDQFISPMALLGGSVEDQNSNLPAIPDGLQLWVTGKEKEDGTWIGGIKDVASVAPERVYRVEVITTVGAVQKRMTGVYDMQYQRSQTQGKGSWLHLREE